MSKTDTTVKNAIKAAIEKFTEEEKQMFNSSTDIHKRLEVTEKVLEDYTSLTNIPIKIPKNNDESFRYRTEGNEYFAQNKFNEALESYNKCIAFAEIDSEYLISGYLRRVGAFLKLKLYIECKRDVNICMQLYSDWSSDQITDFVKMLEHCENEIKNSSMLFEECKEDIQRLTKLSHPKHPKIPFIVDCLELIHTPESGRSIKTNKDLKPGDVIAIERPSTWALDVNFTYRCCTYCLKETFSLIPCPSCTMVMFCSQKCMKMAQEKFHKYECKIINYLFETVRDYRLISIRVALQAISIFKTIDKLIEFEKCTVQDTNIFTLDADNSNYDSDDDDKDDKNKNYSVEMKETNYYPMHGFTRVVTERKNSTKMTYICRAVETILATNQLIPILNDIIKTDDHKRFFKHFIYHQFEVAALYSDAMYYVVDLSLKCTKYGSAIYPFSGLMNHSCAPNIFRTYNGSAVITSVLRPIKQGEQLFDCYKNHYAICEKSLRQKYLKENYYFDCKCEACEKDFPLGKDFPLEKDLDIPAVAYTVAVSTPNDDLKDIIDAIKKSVVHLNLYSEQNYPSLNILQAETKLRCYLSFFLQNRFTEIYRKK